MPDIVFQLTVAAPAEAVFDAVATPEGLDHWWTQRCHGVPGIGAEYELGFGPDCTWRAKVSRCVSRAEFELTLTQADADWTGTRVHFQLASVESGTRLVFSHRGWPEANEHWRISGYCWAMYLRLLGRYLERGEVVPYDQRGST